MNGTLLNVWWMVREDAKVSVDSALATLEKYGIDKDMMAVPTDRVAVRRGIDEMHNRRGKVRRVSEKIRETDTKAVFGILDLHLYPGIDQSAYKQDTKVILDKETGSVEATGILADMVMAKIGENKGVFNDADIRRLCYNVIRECGGISKRPTGGVYLTLPCFTTKIEQLKSAINEMVGNQAAIYTERIFNGDMEKETAAASICEDLTSRVNNIVMAVGKINKQGCRLNAHKASVNKLSELMEMYKTVLGEQTLLEELGNTLQTASDKIEEAILRTSTPVAA